MFSARRIALVIAWLITMVAASGAGAYGYKHRARIRAMLQSVQGAPPLTTNLHTLKIEKLAIPADGRDGGIEVLEEGILFANRRGSFWFIDADKALHPIDLQIPVNFSEFESDPAIANVLYPELFGVRDIALQPTDDGLRLLASHIHWNRTDACNTMRVSSIETTRAALLSGRTVAGTWRTLFETTPCRPLEITPSGEPRMGLGSGGRIALAADGSILLSVGGFDPENELVIEAAQKLDNSYGKTIRLDPETGASSIFTTGHRNPQGLTVAPDGTIWLTEHAARGGDELNRLGNAKNYGYPRVAYGTQYDAMTWPLSTQQGRHDGYEKPMFAWVPSIATSQLIVLRGDAFPHWRGDLMVSSLAAQSLFRVRVEEERVIFVEPIPIGHRIRDIVEAADGTIVLKTDDSFLLYVRPLDASTATTPQERGAILSTSCQGCHGMTPESGSGLGPSLWGVSGRPVASVSDFDYTEALRSVGGRWTAERLREFLSDPQAFAPGTAMQLPASYDEEQLSDLVAYLQTLR